MLKIVMDERLIAKPRVFCDVCGEMIPNDHSACVWYPHREGPEECSLYLVHKGDCHTELDKRNQPRRGAWVEMISFPARLSAGLEIPIQASEEYARQMAELLGASS